MEMGTWQPRNVSSKWLEGTPWEACDKHSCQRKEAKPRRAEGMDILPRGIWLSSGHLRLTGVSSVSSEPMQRARSKAFAHIPQLPQVSSDSFAFLSSLLLMPRGHLNLLGLLPPLWTFFTHFLDLFHMATINCIDSPPSMCKAKAISETKGLKFRWWQSCIPSASCRRLLHGLSQLRFPSSSV